MHLGLRGGDIPGVHGEIKMTATALPVVWIEGFTFQGRDFSGLHVSSVIPPNLFLSSYFHHCCLFMSSYSEFFLHLVPTLLSHNNCAGQQWRQRQTADGGVLHEMEWAKGKRDELMGRVAGLLHTIDGLIL